VIYFSETSKIPLLAQLLALETKGHSEVNFIF